LPKLDIGEAPEGILELSNEEIIKEFELALQAAGASKETVRAYRAAIRDFILFTNNKPLREVTLRDIVNWRNTRARTGFPGSKTTSNVKWQVTLHYYSILLKRFFQWLGLKLRVPGSKRLAPRIDVLSDEDLRKLLNVAKKPQDRLLLTLLISTGLRSRELLELRVEDIDFNSRVIKVRSAKYGKERLVTAPQDVFESLSAWIKLHGLKPGDKIFKISYTGLYKKIKRLAIRAGIDPNKIRPHIIRHTFATLAIRRGLSLPSLQRLLGHSDIRTTQVYLHLTIDDIKREYDEKLRGALGENTKTCTKCNRQIPVDALYCPYCGASLEEIHLEKSKVSA